MQIKIDFPLKPFFHSIVKKIIMYGAEMCSLTKAIRNKIKTVELHAQMPLDKEKRTIKNGRDLKKKRSNGIGM